MGVTEIIYEQSDFKQAASALLPAGEYWQYEQGDSLDNVLEALATEFKTINDETKVSILYDIDNIQGGWKLSDYQGILNNNGISATVFDDSSTPNLIYIDFELGKSNGEFIQKLDEYRLPHTAFCCTYLHEKVMYVAAVRQSLTINRRELRAV